MAGNLYVQDTNGTVYLAEQVARAAGEPLWRLTPIAELRRAPWGTAYCVLAERQHPL